MKRWKASIVRPSKACDPPDSQRSATPVTGTARQRLFRSEAIRTALGSLMRVATGVWMLCTLASSACGSTAPERATTWASDQASLVIAGNKATVQILASGGCYGSYGEIDTDIPSGAFTLSGTFTQLTGVYPGHVQYPAEFAGNTIGNVMTLTITVPSLQRTIGPFHLTAGATAAWPACAYP